MIKKRVHKIVWCLAGLLILYHTGVGQKRSSAAERRSDVEIRSVIKQWAAAMVNRDAAALGKILADDLIVTSFDGTTRGKDKELDVVKPNPNVKTISVDNENVRVKIYGRAAVVTALTKMLFVIAEKPAATEMRYTAVFIKRAGRWQIVALHTSRNAKPNMPGPPLKED